MNWFLRLPDRIMLPFIFIGIPILMFIMYCIISLFYKPEVQPIYQEYLPIRNEYVVVHPKGTDDLIEIFLEQPYKWKVCINGLNHCQEVIIK